MSKDSQTLLDEPPSGQLAAIPAFAKSILIKAIYDFTPSRTVVLQLMEAGVRRSERAVMIWLKVIRDWLGFPGHYPCTSSERSRTVVRQCMNRNGTPSGTEIESGWKPTPPPLESRRTSTSFPG